MQRNLQRIYLDKLVRQTVKPYKGTPHEAVALARLHLTNLRGRIDDAYNVDVPYLLYAVQMLPAKCTGACDNYLHPVQLESCNYKCRRPVSSGQ